jgi:hypothetical protein
LRENFSKEEEIPGTILKTIFSNESLFQMKVRKKNFHQELSARNFLGGNLRYNGIVWEDLSWRGRGYYMGIAFHGGIVCGEKEFSMEGELDFPVLFKNDQKLYKKSFFFKLKARSNIET